MMMCLPLIFIDKNGSIVIDENKRKAVWKEYMEKLLNEENEWDQVVEAEKKEGPECKISMEEVAKAINKMKKGKAAGKSNVVTEMLDGIMQ
jgi:hypothetical protein